MKVRESLLTVREYSKPLNLTHPDNFREKSRHIPVAREGIPYLLSAIFVTLVAAILGQGGLAWLLVGLTLFMGHFFRDPHRVCVAEPQDVISPADGKIILLEQVPSTRFMEGPCLKISIFMSVFDVHVNRISCSGTVRGAFYQKGGFLAANRDRASRENEQNWLWVQSESGVSVVMTQVAGLIARRIVCWPSVGDSVIQGERFGMIRFGSRMDVYVPAGSDVRVKMGEQVYAGETVLCRLN